MNMANKVEQSNKSSKENNNNNNNRSKIWKECVNILKWRVQLKYYGKRATKIGRSSKERRNETVESHINMYVRIK